MKSHILSAIILTFCCLLFLAVLYPLAMFGIGKAVAPNGGQGEVMEANGRVVGYARVGQNFSDDRYFWSRPSAVSYNAAGSAGSNKGPSNPDYLATVQARLDTFLVHNPGVRANQVPSELVTASGSGLDPHLSPQGALVQVARIAKLRNLNARDLELLVTQKTEQPLLGLFGTARVNVLELNLALDNLK
ncbi:MAG: K(+)-transporting ATPase subunit C [Lewinellaceae bacterium]|nr:K(+)-transporting ATPase subunit C [Lewinellaceae bacterium]